MSHTATPLLAANDPPPVAIVNPSGASSFLLIGDHAGNAVPERLKRLGLGADDLARHIGWDIGVGALGVAMAARLDAVFVRQTYSRLVIDCNRSTDAFDAIAEISDLTPVPGNRDLTAADRAARAADIHEPYQQAIGAEITRRKTAGMPTILVALHSFTPKMQDAARPWHAGILHDGGNPAFANRLLGELRCEDSLVVGDNEPYRMDLIDYTVPRHAYAARLPYAEIEVRQDLLSSDAGITEWAERLASAAERAADQRTTNRV